MIFADGAPLQAAVKRSCEIDPVETQDHVGGGDGLGQRRRQEHTRRVDVQRMVGRKRGADLEIGHHHGTQRFGERDARVPRGRIARDAPDQEQRTDGRAQHARRLEHGIR